MAGLVSFRRAAELDQPVPWRLHVGRELGARHRAADGMPGMRVGQQHVARVVAAERELDVLDEEVGSCASGR